jgi:hypothetical protein
MQPLVIYFNEQCLSDTPEDYHWETGVRKLSSVIDDFFKLRTDAHIAFPAGQWQADCGGLHFYERLKNAYPNKDKYRRLLPKIQSLANSDVQLLHEVYWGGISAHGLTLAEAIQSWAVSLFLDDTVWTQPSINAQRYELDESSGNLIGPTSSNIRHLSDISHPLHWATEIRDWGAIVAQSCILDKINGLPVVMYQGPKEHNPPHVHLLDKQSGNSLAKYRIDVFERAKGPPTWDAEMKAWVIRYREQLLKSWARCQQGGLPFEIEN